MKKYLFLGLSLAFLTTLFFLLLNPGWARNNTPSVSPPEVVVGAFPLTTPAPAPNDNSRIQVALLLDTSNSMDGLIDQAKSQLWKMVNDLANMQREGQSPAIEIALFHYGNDDLSAYQGYVQLVATLTTDLDEISDKLFKLSTNGGSEYCGWVMRDAIAQLAWTSNPNDLRLIFIAGNEGFDQGDVDFREVCKMAKEKNILVNTIFCGDYAEGVRLFWQEGSHCSDGVYMNIDQDEKVVHVPTPYDDKVMELNERLNATYIYYGAEGEEKQMNQVSQDVNAAAYSSANTRTRAFFKSKKAYKNDSWDLVDFAEENEIAEIPAEALPDTLQRMTVPERKEFIAAKSKEREAIRNDLQTYEAKVADFIAEKQKEAGEQHTLDQVMQEAIRKQAKEKNFAVKQ